jgi:cell division protein DivIC
MTVLIYVPNLNRMSSKLSNFFKNKYVRNKYSITFFVFIIYFTLLDDVSFLTIYYKYKRLSELNEQNEVMRDKLVKTKKDLKKLYNLESLELYARTEKFFKKPNEDIFVITTETYTQK